jgi:exopolysaccharide biosynthesis polyprenyl glycosylphosphotransferase
MNTPTNPPLNPRLVEHFASFETRHGRWRLQFYMRVKRLLWTYLVNGSHMAKRALDFVLSLIALTLLGPLFIAIAALIKLEDRGPVIFPQTRVGRYGREFKMFKFRSMHPDAEARLREVLAKNQHETGVTFKIKNDPRITRVGRWLRKFSFDELPQFYNVLRGDMSLVGPRPPLPREVAQYSLADRRRLAVKPGITCIWQISGRAEIDFSGQVQLDVRYIESRSLREDVKILCKTIPAVLRGTGAY